MPPLMSNMVITIRGTSWVSLGPSGPKWFVVGGSADALLTSRTLCSGPRAGQPN